MFGRRGFAGGFPHAGGRRGRQRGDPLAMLLLLRLAQQVNELPVKPPVTLGLAGLQAWLFFTPPPMLDRVSDVCMSAFNVVQLGELYRVVAASLFHLDAYHLYYNMSSFLVKGVALEQRLGSPLMLAVTLGLLLATNFIHLALSVALDDWMTCSLGFSGVLFALKVICTYDLENPNQDAFFYGIRLPSKHLVWVEIVFIQAIMPSASFLGHLSGALAGFGFLALRRFAPELLRWIPREPPRTYGQGFWGQPRDHYAHGPHADAPPDPPRAAPAAANAAYGGRPGVLSPEDLRRRRLGRFGG